MPPNTQTQELKLPPSIVSPTDLHHIDRELEKLQDLATQDSIRSTATTISSSAPSQMLSDFAALNALNLQDGPSRDRLVQAIKQMLQSTPILHISFAADPSADFLVQFITKLRTILHPYVLVRIGLDPSIGAGCIVRSTNKQFDFSFRRHFSDRRETLLAMLQQPEQGVAHE